MMRSLLHGLEISWKLLRTVMVPLSLLLVFGASVFLKETPWLFWAVVFVLCFAPVTLEWDSALYTGALAMVVLWCIAVQRLSADTVRRAVGVGFLCLYPVIAGVGYVTDVWAHQSESERFARFPYRFLTARQRLTLALDAGSSYGREADDFSRLSYDRDRDVIRGIASRASSGSLRRAALGTLRYPQDADVLRDVAASQTIQDIRIAALSALPVPDEADFIGHQLATIPEYACYPLGLGWPHAHVFELMDSTRDGSDRYYDECKRYRCACGMEKTVIERVTVIETPGACPECGSTDIDQVWYGDYEWQYQCRDCGCTSDTCSYDFTVTRLDYQTSTVSTEYHMTGEGPSPAPSPSGIGCP